MTTVIRTQAAGGRRQLPEASMNSTLLILPVNYTLYIGGHLGEPEYKESTPKIYGYPPGGITFVI